MVNEFDIEVPTRGGSVRVVRGGHPGWWERFAEGSWEPTTIGLLERVLGPGSVFVDVGAWAGPTTLLAAALGAEVHAYEPDPVALDALAANLAANPELAGRVTVHPYALGARGRMAVITSRDELGDSMASLVRREGGGSVTVMVKGAAEEAAEAHFRRCTLLKIDVEGAEYELVPALLPYLREHRPSLLLSIHPQHWLRPRLPRWVRGPLFRLRAFPPRAWLLLRLARLGPWRLAMPEGWRPVSTAGLLALTTSPRHHEIAFTRPGVLPEPGH